MEKIEFKNLPDTSTPLSAENLNELQANIEMGFNNLVSFFDLNPIDVNRETGEKIIGSYTITETGLYLITGYASPNHYGSSGRELNISIWVGNEKIAYMQSVINQYAFTVTVPISLVHQINANTQIAVTISSSTQADWAFVGGKLQIVKLK